MPVKEMPQVIEHRSQLFQALHYLNDTLEEELNKGNQSARNVYNSEIARLSEITKIAEIDLKIISTKMMLKEWDHIDRLHEMCDKVQFDCHVETEAEKTARAMGYGLGSGRWTGD